MDYSYLVTGADGHLGSWIVKALIKKGLEVRGLRFNGSILKTPIIEKVFYGDVTKKESLYQFFDVKNAKVIHTAGIIDVGSKMSKSLYDVNVNGSKNIIELCKKHQFPLTYVSSVHSFVETDDIITEKSLIDPKKVLGPYAKTKAITTLIMEEERKNIPINIVFPSGILGPNDYGNNHLNSVIKDRIEGKLFSYIDGGYDMVDVRDVSNFICNLSTSTIVNQNFILSNSYILIKDYLEKIGRFIKDNKKIIRIPTNIAKALAPLSEIYYKIRRKPALFSSYSIYTLTHHQLFSHEKATETLGYCPIEINQTIADILKELNII